MSKNPIPAVWYGPLGSANTSLDNLRELVGLGVAQDLTKSAFASGCNAIANPVYTITHGAGFESLSAGYHATSVRNSRQETNINMGGRC